VKGVARLIAGPEEHGQIINSLMFSEELLAPAAIAGGITFLERLGFKTCEAGLAGLDLWASMPESHAGKPSTSDERENRPCNSDDHLFQELRRTISLTHVSNEKHATTP
jgi:hypothetical protein